MFAPLGYVKHTDAPVKGPRVSGSLGPLHNRQAQVSDLV